jgi:hypothetical protein
VRRLVAASSGPGERLIRAACGDGESGALIDQAIDADVLERRGEELRFTHPLLGSALYAEMTLDERREVHQWLTRTADDIEERAGISPSVRTDPVKRSPGCSTTTPNMQH